MAYDRQKFDLDLPLGEAPLDAIGAKLMEAAEYIRTHGWCRGIQADAVGRVCLIGAISAVVPDDPARPWGDIFETRVELRRRINNYLEVHHSQDSYSEDMSNVLAARWNDAPDRTASQVISALRSAARTGTK